MSWEDDVTNFAMGRNRDPNSFSSRVNRFFTGGFEAGAPLGIGSGLGAAVGLYNGLRSAASRRINGTAMPVAGYTSQTPPPTNWGNPFGFDSNSGGNDINDIIRQLQELNDPSRYLQDEGSLRAQAAALAGAKYDPIIAGLRNQAAQATKRGEQGQRDVINIFNQLSDSIKGDIPAIEGQYDTASANQTKQFADLKQGITDQYAKSQAEQAQIYKDLGIEAAASDVTPQQMTDRDYFVNRASTDAQVQNSALTQERQGMVDYTNRHSQNARTEGTQRSADILANLNNLLEQYNANIQANEAAKSQETMAGFLDLQGKNRTNAADQAQRAFQNYIATLNVGRDLRKDQLDEMLTMQKLNGSVASAVKSLADVPNRIMGLGLGGQSAQNIQNVIASSLSDELIRGGLDPDTGQQATPEAKVQDIIESGQRAGLNNQELEALRIAALEYFGRR